MIYLRVESSVSTIHFDRMNTIILAAACFTFALIYASFAEWIIHKYILHRPLNFFGYKFDYPFKGHAVVHHVMFGADATYDLKNHKPEEQLAHGKKIPMAWWNGPALIAMASLPFVIASLIRPFWFMVACIASAITLYYLAYEYFHYLMHDPEGRWCASMKFFKAMNNHHLKHHQDARRNLNVVLPIADIILGTRI